jgi:hypothetical protein
MNTLSADQIQTIQYYWHQLDHLNRKLYKINLKETAIYSQIDGYSSENEFTQDNNPQDNYQTQIRLDRLNEEKQLVELEIQQLDETYERTINSYGLHLHDRDMDEELFEFING